MPQGKDQLMVSSHRPKKDCEIILAFDCCYLNYTMSFQEKPLHSSRQRKSFASEYSHSLTDTCCGFGLRLSKDHKDKVNFVKLVGIGIYDERPGWFAIRSFRMNLSWTFSTNGMASNTTFKIGIYRKDDNNSSMSSKQRKTRGANH